VRDAVHLDVDVVEVDEPAGQAVLRTVTPFSWWKVGLQPRKTV
jgi:hypothetical protein